MRFNGGTEIKKTPFIRQVLGFISAGNYIYNMTAHSFKFIVHWELRIAEVDLTLCFQHDVSTYIIFPRKIMSEILNHKFMLWNSAFNMSYLQVYILSIPGKSLMFDERSHALGWQSSVTMVYQYKLLGKRKCTRMFDGSENKTSAKLLFDCDAFDTCNIVVFWTLGLYRRLFWG